MLVNTLQIPKNCTIGKYQYLSTDIIGEGFYGKVYKAYKSSDKTKVAIKIVSLQEHHQAEELQFLNNELKISKILKHQRIIDCLDIYKKSCQYYFVTELIDDGDLDRYIKQKGCLSESQALKLLKQIIQGMVYVKQKRVIHRDLKPANIFLKNGNVKIADFGLSTFMNGERMIGQSLIGTPRYMAPEILHQGLYTYKCDVWSLGILFLEMVTGQAPFTHCESFQEVVQKVLQTIIPPSLVLSELTMQMLASMLEVRESDRISIEKLNDHFIFHHIHSIAKHLSISTNDSEQFLLEVQQLSAISNPRSRMSSFSNSFNDGLMDDETDKNEQGKNEHTNCSGISFENTEHRSHEYSRNLFDLSRTIVKQHEGSEGLQSSFGEEGEQIKIKVSQQEGIESSDLLQFTNMLYCGRSNEMIL